MGNFAVKYNGATVHHADKTAGAIDSMSSPNSLLRVKVRMTKRQLKELMAKVEKGKLGHRKSEDLGSVIMKECLEGKLKARVVAAASDSDCNRGAKYERSWTMSTISEDDEEHKHLL